MMIFLTIRFLKPEECSFGKVHNTHDALIFTTDITTMAKICVMWFVDAPLWMTTDILLSSISFYCYFQVSACQCTHVMCEGTCSSVLHILREHRRLHTGENHIHVTFVIENLTRKIARSPTCEHTHLRKTIYLHDLRESIFPPQESWRSCQSSHQR